MQAVVDDAAAAVVASLSTDPRRCKSLVRFLAALAASGGLQVTGDEGICARLLEPLIERVGFRAPSTTTTPFPIIIT